MPAGSGRVGDPDQAPGLNGLQTAARILAEHGAAWDRFRVDAHLAGWVAARERGLDVDTCDAVVDAALDGVRRLIRHWAAEDPGDPGE